jgi:hypothetical protein
MSLPTYILTLKSNTPGETNMNEAEKTMPAGTIVQKPQIVFFLNASNPIMPGIYKATKIFTDHFVMQPLIFTAQFFTQLNRWL